MPADDLQPVIRGFRREQVVTTALRLFGARGSLDVSMEEIASAAGVSRSTVYNHFADRDELLRACAESSHDRLATALQKALEGSGSAEVVCRRFLSAAFESLDQNPGFFRLATSLRASTDDAEAVLGAELDIAGQHSGHQISRLIERVRATHRLRLSAASATEYIGVVLVGALHQRAASTDPPPADTAATNLARVLLHGIARDAAPKASPEAKPKGRR